MITLAKFSVEYIMPLIGHGKSKITLHTDRGSFKVKAGTDRLECFKRSKKCVTCPHTGSIFLLQSHIIGNQKTEINCLIDNCEWCAIHRSWDQMPGEMSSPHLNLYHVGPRGGKVLMTKDHIIPKCRGGVDRIDNLQTMCTVCNSHKGAYSFKEFSDNGFCKMDHNKIRLNKEKNLQTMLA